MIRAGYTGSYGRPLLLAQFLLMNYFLLPEKTEQLSGDIVGVTLQVVTLLLDYTTTHDCPQLVRRRQLAVGNEETFHLGLGW